MSSVVDQFSRGAGVTGVMKPQFIHPDAKDAGPRHHYGGTVRSRPPEETLAALLPRLGAFGITRIANVTGLDRLTIPVINVVRPNSKSVSVSTGKGVSVAAAKVSGIMESIESHVAENIDLPVILTSERELRQRAHVIDTARLPKLAGTDYSETVPILWIEGFDLMAARPVWLPYELVHNDYSLPRPDGVGYFPRSSNGLASGNNILEALSHAIFEVVERDAVALFHYLFEVHQRFVRIDLDQVPFEEARALSRIIADKGLEVHVWDITSDVGLPVCFALLWEPLAASKSTTRATVGSGCHTEPAIAMSRAITEAAQDRLTLISGARDDLLAEHYMIDRDFADRIRKSLQIDEIPTSVPQWPAAINAPTYDAELREVLARLQKVGVEEIVAVNLSKPEMPDIAVVRVVIPGLEAPHDDPGYEPGPRLRAKLGVV